MNYYFSLVLALGITSFNLPQENLSLELRNLQTHNKTQLVTQVTTTNTEPTDNKLPQGNESESSVESKTKNLNQNLLLGAIAGTSIFSAILLLLLFKKVEINLDEEQSDSQAENVLDDTVIVEKPQSLANGSEENNAQSRSSEQSGLQDTVLVPPPVSSIPLDAVPELIRQLQNGEPTIRSQTIKKLSQSGDSRAMIPLVELIAEADAQETSLILEAMEKITGSMLKPMNQALLLCLGDDNSQATQNAIRDLTRMYEIMSQVTERLSQTLNESEQKLPETAQRALNQLKQMPAIPTSQLTDLLL